MAEKPVPRGTQQMTDAERDAMAFNIGPEVIARARLTVAQNDEQAARLANATEQDEDTP